MHQLKFTCLETVGSFWDSQTNFGSDLLSHENYLFGDNARGYKYRRERAR